MPKDARFESFMYKSMPEWADATEACAWKYEATHGFSGFSSWPSFLSLARNGWDQPVDQMMDITDKAVRMIEREIPVFEPDFSVEGADVSISRYLDDEPENMIQYPLTKTSNLGPMVKICHDVCALCTVDKNNMIRRGSLVAALILTLERMGHSCEFWVGSRFKTWGTSYDDYEICDIFCKIKGANDLIDPSRIAFAAAHPGVLRGLCFNTAMNIDNSGSSFDGEGMGRRMRSQGFGGIEEIPHSLGEDVVYLPPIDSYDQAPNTDRELRMYLKQIGLIESGEEDDD